jgi:hypothetical protein
MSFIFHTLTGPKDDPHKEHKANPSDKRPHRARSGLLRRGILDQVWHLRSGRAYDENTPFISAGWIEPQTFCARKRSPNGYGSDDRNEPKVFDAAPRTKVGFRTAG